MADLTVPVSAPGAQQAAAEVRRFGASVGEATAEIAAADAAMVTNTKVTAQAGRTAANAARDYKALADAVAKTERAGAAKIPGNGGGHGAPNLGMFAPKGFEQSAARLGSVTGINNALGSMSAIAGPASIGVMAVMATAEVLNTVYENQAAHAKELAHAHIEVTRALVTARDQVSKQGAESAADNDMSLRKVIANGGGIEDAQRYAGTGDKTAVSAVADVFARFKGDDRELVLKAARQASQMGLGSMSEIAGKLNIYSVSNAKVTDASGGMTAIRSLISQAGAVNGRPLTEAEILNMEQRSFYRGDSTMANLDKARQQIGKRANIGLGRIALAPSEEGGRTAAEANPEAEALLKMNREWDEKRRGLEIDAGKKIGIFHAVVGRASRGYLWETPTQVLEREQANFDASTAPLFDAMRSRSEEVASILEQAAAAMRKPMGSSSPASGAP
jgi:hypothetical protein